MSPQELASLPTAALLIVIGVGFFGLLMRGVIRLGRECDRAEKEAVEWKAIAVKSTDTSATQATQIGVLTSQVATLTEIVKGLTTA